MLDVALDDSTRPASTLPGPTPRAVKARYVDPLETIWLALLDALGWRLVRAAEVHVAWDGAGTLAVGSPETLDADDCLAQIVFHELCHAHLEGPERQRLPDWGLENRDDRDLVRERAALRLQAAWAGRHGLRGLLAPTTDHRAYYDALPRDPLADGPDAAITPAREAFARLGGDRLSELTDGALVETARLARLVRPHAPQGVLWASFDDSLGF